MPRSGLLAAPEQHHCESYESGGNVVHRLELDRQAASLTSTRYEMNPFLVLAPLVSIEVIHGAAECSI